MHKVWKQQKPEGSRCSAWWKESKMINATCRRCFMLFCFHGFLKWEASTSKSGLRPFTPVFKGFYSTAANKLQRQRNALYVSARQRPRGHFVTAPRASSSCRASPPPWHLAEIHKDLMYLQCANSSVSVWDDVNRRRRRKRSPERCDVSPYETKTFRMFTCVQNLRDLVLRATAPPKTDHGLLCYDGWASNIPSNYSLSGIITLRYFKSLTKHSFY